ncbi:MAG: hypothetical protein J7J36_06825 [Thermoplasmata archaeon]|nr:hypothetical protein [Thermoplasmata archaeon]
MKWIAILAVLLLIPSIIAAVEPNVSWQPEHPEKGKTVTVYVKDIQPMPENVKLEYCTSTSCHYADMHYENGTWIGNFTMPAASSVNLTIIADGNDIWHGDINAKTSKTPGFEFIIAISSIFFILWRKKK